MSARRTATALRRGRVLRPRHAGDPAVRTARRTVWIALAIAACATAPSGVAGAGSPASPSPRAAAHEAAATPVAITGVRTPTRRTLKVDIRLSTPGRLRLTLGGGGRFMGLRPMAIGQPVTVVLTMRVPAGWSAGRYRLAARVTLPDGRGVGAARTVTLR